MSSNSALFPKRARTVTEQVEVHHEILNRHGAEFTKHADWITGVHQRVEELKREPSALSQKTLRRILMAVYVLGALWTVILAVAVVILVMIVSSRP